MNPKDLNRFKGTGVALVTPFKGGEIDFEAFELLVHHVIEGGVDFLVPLGTTGESVTLSDKETRQVMDCVIRTAAGRVPVVAGHFGGNNTRQIEEQIRNFDFTGVDAILSSSPAYNKPTQEGIFQHYMHIAHCSPVSIIIYNVPGRTSSYIKPKTVIRLAQASGKFAAVKDASGKMEDGTKIAIEKPDHFLLLSGDDPTTLSLMANGGEGVISVIANAFPKQFSEMTRAANNNDFATARRMHQNLLYLHKWLYVEGNPAGIKAALEILDICGREVRLPLVPLTDKNFEFLKREMEKIVASVVVDG